MKYNFKSLFDTREKKQLQPWTCIIWLCDIVAFEGQIAMKALSPSAREFLVEGQMIKVAPSL